MMQGNIVGWQSKANLMKTFTAIIEKDSDTNLYVGYIPGFPGAHSQGETLDELQENLREVIEMLLEDDNLVLETEFIGTQQIVIR
ncbi:type II toxin-antitoxin system HicB family antitoxin [Planktothrix serta]